MLNEEDKLPWILKQYEDAGIKITKLDRNIHPPMTHVLTDIIGGVGFYKNHLDKEEWTLGNGQKLPKEIFWHDSEWKGESNG